jgi:hypothetical protein
MAAEEVKISSDADYVFISGVSKEVKEETIRRLMNSGFAIEEQSQKFALILMFLIRS